MIAVLAALMLVSANVVQAPTPEKSGVGTDVSTVSQSWNELGLIASKTVDGVLTSFEYTPRGELERTTIDGHAWNYRYDPVGNLNHVEPPNGPLREQGWTHDVLGRVLTHNDGPRQWSTVYSDGAAITTSPSGDIVKRVVDPRGRMLLESVTMLGTSSVASVSSQIFRYDGLDALRSMQEDLRSPSTYAYDASHRLQTVTRGLDSVSWTFDGASERRSTLTNGTNTITYGYDAKARLNSLSGPWGATTVTWEPGGQRLSSLSDLLVTEQFCFNGPGRITRIDYAGNPCSGIASANTRSYTHDAHGNPKTETYSGLTRTFDYDGANRLTGFTDWNGVSTSYNLHPDGSRDTETVGGVLRNYAYNTQGALESVTISGGAVAGSWTYLDDGRVASRTVGGVTSNYQWDALGRLVGATTPAGTSTFQYDGLGLRRSSTLGGVQTESFTWVGETQIAEGSDLVAAVGPFLAAQGDTRFAHDALGSVVQQSSGFSTSQASYSAWGKQSGGTQLTSNAYTGHRRDPSLGLTQAQQRWLDNDYGIFLSRDPIGASSRLRSPIGLGPWSYAAGSPSRFVDLDGRFELDYGYGEPVVFREAPPPGIGSNCHPTINCSPSLRAISVEQIEGLPESFIDELPFGDAYWYLASADTSVEQTAAWSERMPGQVRLLPRYHAARTAEWQDEHVSQLIGGLTANGYLSIAGASASKLFGLRGRGGAARQTSEFVKGDGTYRFTSRSTPSVFERQTWAQLEKPSTAMEELIELTRDTTRTQRLIDSGRALSGAEPARAPINIALGYRELYRANGRVSSGPIGRRTGTNVKQISRKVNRLAEFANEVNAKAYWDWGTPWNGIETMRYVASQEGTNIHFNLDGFRRKGSAMAGLAKSSELTITESELLLILKTPALRNKTTFYRNGAVIPNPKTFFGKELWSEP